MDLGWSMLFFISQTHLSSTRNKNLKSRGLTINNVLEEKHVIHNILLVALLRGVSSYGGAGRTHINCRKADLDFLDSLNGG